MIKLKSAKKGFTLIELVVTLAVMAIAGTFLTASFTQVLESKRIETDFSQMNQIEIAVEEIIMRDDIVGELLLVSESSFVDQKIKVADENTGKLSLKTIEIPFEKNDNNEIVLKIDEIQAVGGGSVNSLKEYLTENLGQTLILKSHTLRDLEGINLEIQLYADRQNKMQDWALINDKIDAHIELTPRELNDANT